MTLLAMKRIARAKAPENKIKLENLRSDSKEAPSSSVVYPASDPPYVLWDSFFPPGPGLNGGGDAEKCL